MENIQLEYPVLITGGDGSALWFGCGSVATVVRGVNTDTSAIAAGQAVAWDPSGLRIQPWDRSASSGPIQQIPAHKLATTTGNLDSFAGVALAPAPAAATAPTGQSYPISGTLLAGPGSVVPVKSTAVGTIRYNCVASATAGSITPQSAIGTAPGATLGHVVKIGGTTGGTTDSGSSSYPLVAVNIY